MILLTNFRPLCSRTVSYPKGSSSWYNFLPNLSTTTTKMYECFVQLTQIFALSLFTFLESLHLQIIASTRSLESKLQQASSMENTYWQPSTTTMDNQTLLFSKFECTTQEDQIVYYQPNMFYVAFLGTVLILSLS